MTYDICVRFIDFIDRNYQSDFALVLFYEPDNFFCLRHDAVICCNDKNNNVRHSGASCAHGRKSSMAWSVKKGDGLWPICITSVSGWNWHRKSPDVLSDTASLALGHGCGTQCVKQSSFTMIDVA